MEYNNSKEKEIIVDIEIDESSHEAHANSDPVSGNKWRKISLNKLFSGVLGLNGPDDGGPTKKSDSILSGSVEYPNKTATGWLVGKNQEPSPNVERDDAEEKKKAKKAHKPPRPPRGPSLDAADMRLIKEISKIAMKKRERIERIKALKKMKTTGLPSSSSSSSSPSSSLSSSSSTISAMVITVLFFLVLIFQGLGSSTSSNMRLMGAPQSAPETRGLTPVQFYETLLSDDGAAPSFVPSKSVL
ncbi:hypothetical protein OROHE_025604 [Orobanche hederae]